jgi:hypothetical protein
LSLTVLASSMNAVFGGVCGFVVDVAHMMGAGDGPGTTFVATQPAGKAGAVTKSKFSNKPGHGVPVGVAVAVAVAVGVLVGVDVEVADGEAVGVAVGVGDGPPSGATRT